MNTKANKDASAVAQPTDAETIAALTAKCALLSASLKQAEEAGRQPNHRAAVVLGDCAALMESYADWHGALFQAIQRYAKTDAHSLLEPMDIGDRQTVSTLAGLGVYLSETASGIADGYAETAEELRRVPA